MGKIRVADIAQKMGVPEQDLVFKLKSIGVRVEGDDGLVDTELIKALLTGKKLPQTPQREVILRDEQAAAQQPTQVRRPPSRRMPQGPQLRPPGRRRTVVSKGDKIRTLPTSEPARRHEPTTPAAPPVAPPPIEKKPVSRKPVAAKDVRKSKAPSERARKVAELEEREDLHDFRGDVKDLEAAEEATVAPVAPEPVHSRRSRRAERKEQAAQAGQQIVSSLDPEEVGTITVSEGMRVRDLAEKLGVKSKDLLRALMTRGVMATVNHVLDTETAVEVASQLGFEAMTVTFEEEVQLQQEAQQVEASGKDPRAPVVTVMGHVDHGKTTLLDSIRSSNVTEGEHGGITQHIAAYKVDVGANGVVFLDTPGHEAFTKLRARGAQVTDVVVLVVAADDGVMPQTKEAIDHARAADVPIIVAINKMDKSDANPDRVKKELADNELLVEDWGGEVVAVPVAAIEGKGVAELLEMINLNAEILELSADRDLPAQGTIIEAQKVQGRGTVATVLVQNGTMRVGDPFVAGATWGRVRSMLNDRGERIEEAGPSTPVEVAGFQELPDAGDVIQVVEEESKARQIAEFRQEEQRQRDLAPSAGRMSLESLFQAIAEDEVKELPVVIKADVQGSVEVLKDTLRKASTDKVQVKIIRAGVGAVTTHDVYLAASSNAIIYGFNVRPERNAAELAAREEVEIRSHTVIYELIDELKKAMAGLLEPTFKEVGLGRAEVREIFKVPRFGMIAGCHVVEGVIQRNAAIRLLRDNVVIHEGKLGSLRRFKDDATEVRNGFDCGIGIESFQDVKPGDIIEAFTQEAVAATL